MYPMDMGCIALALTSKLIAAFRSIKGGCHAQHQTWDSPNY